ncbi:coiled-coil domain-containing protein 115-like [Dermacentor silvarum]|uniref:coiled-coil domain-containing protein 115-like n=1 Tax=Dermacentor silvarum TaxID=543639 RepID=UPI00189736B3|nr:coiled-coil domain-containing protein 115-like [Dermacentor silvarum]
MADRTQTSAAPTETPETTAADTGKLDDSTDREREKLLENAIDSAEKILQLRESLNELIENGLLELARVRYSTGNKSVSALQLNMGEVEALRTVRSNFEDPNQSYPSFELLQPDSTGSTVKEGEVRQRRQAEEPSTEAVESPPKRPTSPSDPLRWFGVLVPQSLRRSQKCFISALEVVVDVANEQSRLAVALDTYRSSQRAATVSEVEP